MNKKHISAVFAAILSCGLCSCSSFNRSNSQDTMKMKAYIPVGLYHNGAVASEDLIGINRRFSVENFFICGPGVSVRLTGYPGIDRYEKIAQQINDLRSAVAGTPIKLNWWCGPLLKLGFNSTHQHIVGADGKTSPISICPLDENFKREVCERFALVAQKARPEVILIEDDYSLQNHSNAKFGCFCPLHLEAFAKKCGKNYSREELEKIFREDKVETLPLRKLWAECAKESLISLAAAIRAAVDKVAPETRIGICETLNTDADGFAIIDIARALAGKKTRPFVRLRCAWYTSFDSPQKLPDYLAHTAFTAERIPEDFEFVIEGDTYPHTTYFISPALLKANLINACSLGADSCLLYGAQYLDDPAEDPAYFEMFKRNAAFFKAVSRIGNSVTLDGARIIYDPLCHSAKKLARDGRTTIVHTSAALARMGIPSSTLNGKPDILIGQNAAVISDTEITKILRGGVLLDAEAAEILERRGYGELIGVSVKPVEKYGFVGEKLCDVPLFAGIKGRYVYNLAFAPAGSENAVQYKNPVPRKGAEVLSYFFDPEENFMQPGMVLFTNKLGGKVCVLASTISFNLTANLFNLRKQEMLRRVLNYLRGSELPATVLRTPNCWLRFGQNADAAYLFITNLSTASRENIQLALAPELRGRKVSELQNDGSWCAVDFETSSAGAVTVPGVFAGAQCRVFKIERQRR